MARESEWGKPMTNRETILGRRARTVSGVFVVVASIAWGLSSWAQSLPEGFTDTAVFTGLDRPTAVRFSPDGRVFVAEKSGRVKVFDGLSDPTPDVLVDLSTNVHDYWDRGLLGLALDPAFPSRPYVYVLYTYDYDPNTPGIPPPRWGDVCPTPPGPTIDGCVVNGRLSRLEVGPGNTLVGGEQVLLENNWCQQYPSHSVGALNFGPEGALYVQAGDAASFVFADYGQGGGRLPGTPTPRNPCGDPPAGRGGTQTPPTAEGGALRAQDLRTATDPLTWDGSVLRVDPATGLPWPDNPLVGGASSDDDRTIAYGLRNPFRSTVRPGTSELWIGDVGWNDWEEIDRIVSPTDATVENFGWPCYEGNQRQAGYDGLDLDLCENLYAAGPGAVVFPYYAYHHNEHVDPAGDACPTGGSAISGLAFYQTGTYPAGYEGALFFADYSRDCIYVIRRGADGLPDLSTRTAFEAGALNPVDLVRGPGGDLYYADFDGGTIRRIQFTSGNTPPTAVAQAFPDNGPVPLEIQFDGSSSSDPDPGATLFYRWDLDGDGAYDDASIVNPVYTYTVPGTVVVGLEVTDDRGATSTTSVTVYPGNTRPTATVTAPPASLLWKVGDAIPYSGEGSDPEDGPLGPSSMRWDIVLHHCPGGPGDCHSHLVEHHEGTSGGTFTAPDHEWYSYIEFVLTVTDSGGLDGEDRVSVDPVAVTNSYTSDPPGLALVVGGVSETAPFDRPAIVGSTNSISAPSPQMLDGTLYYWTSWSDGGAQAHDFIAGETPETRTATFAVCGVVELCDGLDNDCNGIPDDALPPAAVSGLTVDRQQLQWVGLAEATAYDVVRGDLERLRETADFALATEECLADDLPATSLPYTGEPGEGAGFWFLARAVNCAGEGTYDSGAPSQAGSRDGGIASSAGACP